LRSGSGWTTFDPWRASAESAKEVVLAAEEERKRAYKAFKKRLKLARLDDESGLSRGSKGSSIAGITPPTGFPAGIWEELVAQGKLKREGAGTYSLAQEL
jgi:hypothetical protein